MSVEVRELMNAAFGYRASASAESEWRACISRAYYAAFHAADEFHKKLPTAGHTSGRHVGVHEILIEQLTAPSVGSNQPNFRTSKSIGYILRSLKQARVVADYRLEQTVDITDVANVFANAERLISATN